MICKIDWNISAKEFYIFSVKDAIEVTVETAFYPGIEDSVSHYAKIKYS